MSTVISLNDSIVTVSTVNVFGTSSLVCVGNVVISVLSEVDCVLNEAISFTVCFGVDPCVVAFAAKDHASSEVVFANVEGVITIFSKDGSLKPVITLVNDIVAITGVDDLVIASVSSSSVYDVFVAPDVLVQVICAVLVITINEFVSGLFMGAVTIDVPPVSAYDITACVSVDILVSTHFVAAIDRVISGATVCPSVATDFASDPDLVVSLFAVEFLLLVPLFTVCCDKILSITKDIYSSVSSDVLSVDSKLLCFVIKDGLIDNIITFASLDCYAAGVFLA